MNKKKEMYLVLLGISDDLAFSRGRKVCLLGSDAFLKSIEMARKAVPFFCVCVVYCRKEKFNCWGITKDVTSSRRP